MRRTVVLVAALLVAACSPSDGDSGSATPESSEPTTTSTVVESTTTTTPPEFGVVSPRFSDGETVPTEFTCDGPDVNPPLDIVGIPEGTQSLVVIVDDPDAPVGVWDHWVEFDIRTGPGEFEIPQDTAALGVEGVNSWNLEGYMGPCPPPGDNAHIYRFTVYAVDGFLGLPPGVDSEAVRTEMEGGIIQSVQITGTYGR